MSVVFARQVTVFDPATGRIVDKISRATAIVQCAKGLIAAELSRDGQVVWAKRIDTGVELDAKPGSFGIFRNHMPCGAVIFEHNAHYGEVLAA